MAKKPPLPGKLTMPACPGAVPRPRLFARLDGARAQATWVAGPPGSGKTSLVASHLAGEKGRVLWYRCDPQDRDPANLFHHLGLALPLGDGIRSATRLADPVGLARAVFRGLARRRGLPATFVFDDCHEVDEGSPFFEVLREAMRELPSDRRFIFVSRRTEPAAWARQAVSGELARISPDELAFTEAEARALVGAGAADVPGLLARSGGWAAGLTLLMAGHGGAGAPGAAGPGVLFDYFAAEVLDRLPAETRALLLHASLYRELPAGLLEAAGYPDAAARLDALARERFFVTVQPGAPHGHRLHDLFREFLRLRRATLGTPADRSGEAAAAARRLEARGAWDEATGLLLEHGRWPEAAALLRSRGEEVLAEGRHRTLLGWIEAIPPEARGDDGWLDQWRGQGLLPLDPAAARQAFEAAARAFEAHADQVGQVLATCGAIESWVAEWNEVAPLRPLAARLEALLGQGAALPPQVTARAAIGLFAALMYGQPDSPALDGWVEQVRAIVLAAPDPGLRLEVGSHLLIFQTWWRGDLAAAGHLVDVLSPLAGRDDLAPQRRVLYMAMLAGFQWMVADHDAALATVARGLALGRAEGIALFDVLLHAQGAFAALAAGRREEARAHLDAMSARLGSRRRLDALLYHYLAAWAALADDDPDRAASHALAARGDVEASGSPFHTANALVCAGILQDRRGEPAAATTALEQALALSRATRNRAVEYQALLHLGDQALRRGARPEGLAFLGEALGLARRQGFRSHAFWSAPGMARLYGEALAAGLEPEYAAAMVRRHGLAPPPGADARWPWRYRLRVLGATAVERDGAPLHGAGGGKAVELLEALAALGGAGVAVRAVADALWPDAEGDQARRSLDTTLHRARRLLGDEGALVLEGGLLSFAPGRWYVDLLDLQGVLAARGEAREPAELPPLLARAAALWRGEPLAGREAPWLERPRRLLRERVG
ncbi:MAG: hypothetical protein NDI82_07380, partial [Anaeromyxobacteraceae bacterium]|nr:hypothetical protein [Anaeromyxobacteraceae bacterium]